MWVWASMVVDCGRCSRPGLPCLRAAVFAYLFQIAIVIPSFVIVRASDDPVAGRASIFNVPRGRCGSEHAQMLAQVDAVLAQFRRRGDDRDAAGVEDDDVVGDVEHPVSYTHLTLPTNREV